jgi:hypothetical protein
MNVLQRIAFGVCRPYLYPIDLDAKRVQNLSNSCFISQPLIFIHIGNTDIPFQSQDDTTRYLTSIMRLNIPLSTVNVGGRVYLVDQVQIIFTIIFWYLVFWGKANFSASVLFRVCEAVFWILVIVISFVLRIGRYFRIELTPVGKGTDDNMCLQADSAPLFDVASEIRISRLCHRHTLDGDMIPCQCNVDSPRPR